VRRFVRDPSIQILITLITPFIAYIPAEQLHVSGVLATVVVGVYLGTRTEGMLQPASRVSGAIFWRTLVFLLESTLFVLLGLELRSVVDHLSTAHSAAWLAGAAAAEVAAVIVIRMAWELIVSPLIRFLPGRHSGYVRNPWRQRLVIGWGGMRGAISLAIALTLPLTQGGKPFAERPTLIFLAAANVYRQLFEMRLDRVRAALGDTDGDGGRPSTSGFRAELVRAERDKLAELYRGGKISDDIRRSISRSLDLEERRGFGLPAPGTGPRTDRQNRRQLPWRIWLSQ